MFDAAFALDVAARGASLTLTIGFLEQLRVSGRSFAASGLYSAQVVRLIGAPSFTEQLGTTPLRVTLAVGTVFSILCVAFGIEHPLGRLALAMTFLCAVASRHCRIMGGDGSEQMSILILFAACVAVLPGPDDTAILLAACFIGAQLVLSYLTAGVVKAVSPTWRDGSAIALVMGSEAYGQHWMGRFTETRAALSRLLTRAVFVGECLFPLILIAPRGIAFAMLAVGFVFHAATAFTMGLNTFVIAFPATFLCVLVLVERVSPFW